MIRTVVIEGRARPPLGKALALAVVVALAPACGAGPASAALPKGPAVVDVTMGEYAFVYEGAVPAGRVVFRISNAGQRDHRLDLLPLAEEIPPIDAQLRGSVRQVVTPFARVPVRQPGQSGTFAADLVPGQRYALVCFLQDADGESHALKGMATEFRAEALAVREATR